VGAEARPASFPCEPLARHYVMNMTWFEGQVALPPRTPDHFLYETLLPHPRSRLCREVSGPADVWRALRRPTKATQGGHSRPVIRS